MSAATIMWEWAQQKHPAGSHGADGHSHGKLLPEPLSRARGTHTKQNHGAGSPHGRRHRDVSSYLWGKSKPGSLHVLPKHGAFSTPLCVPTESSCKWH